MAIKIADLNPSQIFKFAQEVVIEVLPFVRAKVDALIPVETMKVETLATSQRLVCFYNPEYVKSKGIAGLAGVILHEIGHPMNDHYARAERAGAVGSPKLAHLWNLCADAEINQNQPEALPLPDNAVYPYNLPVPQENGKLAEEYYAVCLRELLKQEEEEEAQQDQDPDQDQDQDQDGAAGEPESGDSDDGTPEEDQDDGAPGDDGEPQEGGTEDGDGDGQGDGQEGDGEPQDGASSDQGDQEGDAEAQGSGQGEPSDGPEGDAGQGSGQGEPQATDGQGDGQGEPQESPPVEPGCGGCGSCSGNKVEGETDDGTYEGMGRSDAEMDAIREEVAKEIHKADADEAGSVPGAWKMWADNILKPTQVRWEDELSRLVRNGFAHRRGLVDYKSDRPSRRQAGIGFGPRSPMLPRMFAPMPETVFVADVSYSMHGLIEPVMAQTQGVLKALGGAVRFGTFDAQMSELRRVRNIDDCLKNLIGGGGTSFVPVFDAVSKAKPKPQLLIIGTDAVGAAPEREPHGMTVLWVIISKDKNKRPWVEGDRSRKISWGRYMYIDPETLQATKAA